MGHRAMKWDQELAHQLGTHHSDTQAVIRAGRKGAKRRTNRRARRTQFTPPTPTERKADQEWAKTQTTSTAH